MKNCSHCGKLFVPKHNSVTRCSVECNFWSKVDKKGCDDCWPWTASKLFRGYGQFVLPGGRHICASRFSWILHNGPISDDILVLHDCPNGDNPSCVNPKHLWLGDQQDNIDDMDDKGRRNPAFGERNCRAIVTSDIIRAVRLKYSEGDYSFGEIAAHFRLKEHHVWKIIRRKIWAHVQ